MPDFSKRDTTPELMDTEVVSYEELRGALRQLTQANELSLAYRPTLSFFKRLAREGRLARRPAYHRHRRGERLWRHVAKGGCLGSQKRHQP